ncbi:MAG: Fic family protein [Nitrospinae bacterium]|nr:Fic family protein [Nitrospinota bacterium]
MPRYIWKHARWPALTWRGEDLMPALSQCRKRQGTLLGAMSAMGLELATEARSEILVTEAIQTSLIEGAPLNLAAVRSSVANRLGLVYAGVPFTDRRADGLVELLLDGTARFDEKLSVSRLNRWHAALFPSGYSGLHKITAGKYRPGEINVLSGPVGKEKVHFSAPPPRRVPGEMKRFLRWWHVSRENLDGLLRAGVAHFYFVTIHPYEDGNGRLARALTDVALAQDERRPERFYSMSAQIASERNAYYETLERAQKSSLDITSWLRWFLECLERAIDHSENVMGGVFYKARFWAKFNSAPLSAHQRKVIVKLLDAGPDGFEGGLTTRKFVSMAKVSRATAYREITDLVDKGILVHRPGGGRSVSYTLAPV